MQNGQFGLKTKHAKTLRKTALPAHYSWSMQKTARKNRFEKWEHFENGHNAKAIAHAKYPLRLKK